MTHMSTRLGICSTPKSLVNPWKLQNEVIEVQRKSAMTKEMARAVRSSRSKSSSSNESGYTGPQPEAQANVDCSSRVVFSLVWSGLVLVLVDRSGQGGPTSPPDGCSVERVCLGRVCVCTEVETRPAEAAVPL